MLEHAARTDVEKLDVFDPFGKLQSLPMPREELVEKAVASRPDLLAIKIGVRRARPTSGWLGPTAIPTSTCSISPTRSRTTPISACPAPIRGLWA